MILDERTYAKPAHVRDYLNLYVAEGMALQVSHLGHLVGWFTTDTGVVNEVVHAAVRGCRRPGAPARRPGSRPSLAGLSRQGVALRP